MVKLILSLLILLITYTDSFVVLQQSRRSLLNTKLRAVNKRGRAQNQAVDLAPSKVVDTEQVKELKVQLKEVIDENIESFMTGDDMRSKREKDLKIAKVEADAKQVDYSVIRTDIERKWDIEKVDTVIACLNRVYELKMNKGPLSESERAGLFEWEEFNSLCEETGVLNHLIIDDTTTMERELERVHKWIQYHRKKGDISFKVDERLLDDTDDGVVSDDVDDGDEVESGEVGMYREVWEWTPRPRYKRKTTSRKHPKKLNPKWRKRVNRGFRGAGTKLGGGRGPIR